MEDRLTDMVALEVGRLVVGHLFPPDWDALGARIDGHLLQTLEAIQAALDDEALTDFYCLDRIVEIMNGAGLTTSRHDFG